MWRRPAAHAALRRPEHGFHFAQARRQQAQRARATHKTLQATPLVNSQAHAGRVEQRLAGEHGSQDGPADRLLGRMNRLGNCARSLNDGPVLDSRRARGLARAAIQAGVDMLAKIRIVGADLAFVDLAHLIDATAR